MPWVKRRGDRADVASYVSTGGCSVSELVCRCRIRVACPNLCRRPQQRIERLQRWQLRPAPLQRLNQFLRRNVAHQGLLCKRTSAQASDGGVKASAAGVIRRKNLPGFVFGPAAQMHPYREAIVL